MVISSHPNRFFLVKYQKPHLLHLLRLYLPIYQILHNPPKRCFRFESFALRVYNQCRQFRSMESGFRSWQVSISVLCLRDCHAIRGRNAHALGNARALPPKYLTPYRPLLPAISPVPHSPSCRIVPCFHDSVLFQGKEHPPPGRKIQS